jgi:E-phenylitaconyl-CoA hydratase
MTVTTSREGAVATVVIDRPEKLNALDISHLKALREAIARCDAEPTVRVLVLTGSGGRAFCAGADLGAAAPPASFAEAFGQDLDRSAEQGLYVRLFDLAGLRRRKPLIAAVEGYCLGGGLELALQCDLIVASASAQFGLPEVAVGSLPGAGGAGNLLRAVPRAVAMHLLLTGERIGAERALAIGLVSAVWPVERFLDEVAALAGRIANQAPLAVQMVKMLADHAGGLSPAQAMQMTELTWGHLRDTEDRKEGKQAFAEKRTPRYVGR